MTDVPETTDWATDGDGWSRNFGGLELRVWPDPDDPDEPWTYEVVLADGDAAEYDIALGGAADPEAAKAAAEAAAAAYGNGEDDASDDG